MSPLRLSSYHIVHQDSCETLAGVGPFLKTKLAQCGIRSIADLLFHLPYRYQDRTRVTPMAHLLENTYAVVVGQVVDVAQRRGRRAFFDCVISDGTGQVTLRFFNIHNGQLSRFTPNQWISAFGEIKHVGDGLVISHPEYRCLETRDALIVNETLTPIYPSTEGLTQFRIRQLIKQALVLSKQSLQDMEWMTPETLAHQGFLAFSVALHHLHNPMPDTRLELLETGEDPGLRRLIFDELMANRLGMAFARRQRYALKAPPMPISARLIPQFLAQLPYQLTDAQTRVGAEVADDLTHVKPTYRLIQGDVGCGKTTLAALAALQAIEAGYQVAIMAPTELLCEQHAAYFSQQFSRLGLETISLTGKLPARERKVRLAALADGRCQLAVGTHALFQEAVVFKRLGLVIIDEQHRFGVEQRLLLHQKGQIDDCVPHQLLMTATPIPRTLAMAQYAHLDISIVDGLPPGRQPIKTAVLPENRRDDIVHRLKQALKEGKQAYWICTLVAESEKLQCTAAIMTAEWLHAVLPEARVGLLHGQMKSAEKESTMLAFKEHALDLLVATTVIEVGVDVPKASLMVIENAERLGLSQLHQLRGRVGRGHEQSFCILLYQSPLSEMGAQRLHLMRDTVDGFLIAEKDLAWRGGGEVLGTRQTGYRAFKVADLGRDADVLNVVGKYAQDMMKDNIDLAKTLVVRWLGSMDNSLV